MPSLSNLQVIFLGIISTELMLFLSSPAVAFLRLGRR